MTRIFSSNLISNVFKRSRCLVALLMIVVGSVCEDRALAWRPMVVAGNGSPVQQDNDQRKQNTRLGMKRAADYFHRQVSSHGGYVYYVTEDLQQRWGETITEGDEIYVQPPGTPTVGMAFLQAYQATSDPDYLDWAHQAGVALVQGQLKSGGWDQVIYFDTKGQRRAGDYRTREGGKWSRSSLDDDQTQAALRFLMTLDQVSEFKDQQIHEAVQYGMDGLLSAQFSNGAFPQVFAGPAENVPTLKASYPSYDWRSEGRVKNYWDQYTLNDGLAGTVCQTLILADQIYQEQRYRDALARLGDFLLDARMPEPQPGWCQQYSRQMHPVWARKFEPPAITGSESQDAMRTLIRIAEYLQQPRYLEPIPASLNYFRERCVLNNGQVARYYELQTNRPLYMDSQYRLTYDDQDVPNHYSWKVKGDWEAIEEQLHRVKTGQADKQAVFRPSDHQVQSVLDKLDDQGRWLEPTGQHEVRPGSDGKLPKRVISSRTFARNLQVLSSYLQRTNQQSE